jgi:hypothetical protein
MDSAVKNSTEGLEEPVFHERLSQVCSGSWGVYIKVPPKMLGYFELLKGAKSGYKKDS